MRACEAHPGEQVVVFRSGAQRAAERARLIGVREGSRLRVEFPDGHQCTCDPAFVASLQDPRANGAS